jgi:DNA-directed RNA polymerase specialized sigma24 family protein
MRYRHLKTVSDERLLADLCDPNRESDDAFAVLVDRYHRTVFSIAYRFFKSIADAETAEVETFATAFKKASEYDPLKCTVQQWLLAIGYSCIINLAYEKAEPFENIPCHMVN